MRVSIPRLSLPLAAKLVLPLGLIASAAALIWPIADETPGAAPSDNYGGAPLEVRATSAPRQAPFTFNTPRPAAEPTTAASAPTLVGIAGASAYLRGADGGVARLSPGSEIDGWRVQRIGSRSVEVSDGQTTRRLELFQSTAEAPAAAAQPAAGQN